jgi:hypothetical protein
MGRHTSSRAAAAAYAYQHGLVDADRPDEGLTDLATNGPARTGPLLAEYDAADQSVDRALPLGCLGLFFVGADSLPTAAAMA